MGKDATTPALRELFVEELAQVQGGESIESLMRKLGLDDDPLVTTMACCEENPDPCC